MLKNKNDQNDFIITVLRVLKVQLEMYPLLSLMDIYKSFFQDAFGPGHLLIDPERARTSFKEELRNMKSYGHRVWEPCGMSYNFCRVPMDLVLDGSIDEENYFSAFIAGSLNFSVPDIKVWKKTWQSLLKVFSLKSEFIQGFSEDSEYILKTLDKGIFEMNHSKRYREIYEPHYRIFTLKQKSYLYNLYSHNKL
ncbi:MAG: hypothetical protein WC162_01785 [Sphaerochaetaceae bacterium]